MRPDVKSISVLAVLALAGLAGLKPARASAQDRSAGRVEIEASIFGGGMMSVPSPTPGEDASRTYVLSGRLARNLTKWIGLEGEVGVALGSFESTELYGALPQDQRSPNVMIYGGNVVYNVIGSHRRTIPYVSGGFGGLSVFGGPETVGYGLAANTSYLTATAGTGVRFYPMRHWGVRGDYQFIGIKNDALPPPPGQRIVRSAQKFSIALVWTY